MIRWIHLTTLARTREDFDVLTRLLESLGFKSGERESYPHAVVQSFFPTVAAVEVFHRNNDQEAADIELTISDPDSAAQIIRRMGLEVLESSSGQEPENSVRCLRLRLPGGTTVAINGLRTTTKRSEPSDFEGNLQARGKRFGIVASRFNSFITERLLDGALDCLERCGVESRDHYDVVRVPGAFEVPSAARTLAQTRQYDAIICLGCLLRGDTVHYDVIVNEVTRGIGQSAQDTGVPHAFGVLTCDTLEQAIDRAGLKMGNKGFEAALAAIEMANLKEAIRSHSPAVGSKRERLASKHPASKSISRKKRKR